MVRSLGRFYENEQTQEEISSTSLKPRKIKIEHGNEDVGDLRSIIGAPVKGAAKELREQIDSTGKAFGLDKFIDEKAMGKGGGVQLFQPQEEFETQIEELLPTKDRFLEAGLERGGRIAPYAATGGIGAILRSLGAGLAGQGVEELGGGPIAQLIGEVGAQGLPGLAKKITGSKGVQKELVDFARKVGLKEEQIAPLIQSAKKSSLLGKAAYKGTGTQKRLKEAKSGLNLLFDSVENSPAAQKSLTESNAKSLLNEMEVILRKMPVEERQFILNDFLELAQGGFKGKDLINFYRDINSHYSKGRRALGGLLDPVKKAIKSISPELEKQFGMTNQFFKNYLNLSRKLKPSKFEDLMKLGRKGRILAGLAFHNPLILTEAIGEAATKKLFTEMLLNPRYQNLMNKLLTNLQKGKIAVAREAAEKLTEEAKKVNRKPTNNIKE